MNRNGRGGVRVSPHIKQWGETMTYYAKYKNENHHDEVCLLRGFNSIIQARESVKQSKTYLTDADITVNVLSGQLIDGNQITIK